MAAIENAYNGTSISSCCGNPLGGRPAFTGWSGGYIRSRFDLTPYAGSSVWIRFRLGTDWVVAQSGWWIDDIEIGELIVNDALVDAGGGTQAGGAADTSARHTTQVPEPSLSVLLISEILALVVLGRGRYRA
jgi:bacillopeptidase F (M6 metalloprotease family)